MPQILVSWSSCEHALPGVTELLNLLALLDTLLTTRLSRDFMLSYYTHPVLDVAEYFAMTAAKLQDQVKPPHFQSKIVISKVIFRNLLIHERTNQKPTLVPVS